MSLSLFRNALRHSARLATLICLLAASALAARAQVVWSNPVKVVTNAVANIEVFQIQNTPTGTVNQDMSVTASGNSTSGTTFRFDPTSNQYIYNLNTSGYASGTYLLHTTISDGSTHDVQISIQ